MKTLTTLSLAILLNSCVVAKKHTVKVVTVNDTAYVKLSDYVKIN